MALRLARRAHSARPAPPRPAPPPRGASSPPHDVASACLATALLLAILQ